MSFLLADLLPYSRSPLVCVFVQFFFIYIGRVSKKLHRVVSFGSHSNRTFPVVSGAADV